MAEVQLLPIGSVKPNPSNPRIIKDDKFHKLVQSLEDFPEMMGLRPIVCNTDMVILGGNMRFRAAKEAGWKEIPVIVADIPEEKQREFIIKDNVGFGEWDWDLLANEWEQESLIEWGIEIPDVTDSEKEEPEEDGKSIFPLAIILTAWEYKEFQRYKRDGGFRTDTDAFKHLFNNPK